MVYCGIFDNITTTFPFDSRILEDKGRGVFLASSDMHNDCIYIRRPYDSPWSKNHVSVVICTYGRPESLNETLISLTKQTFKDFEIILITEKGDLSKLRDTGLRCARGDIVSFIDDDVYCPSIWLQSVVKCFGKGNSSRIQRLALAKTQSVITCKKAMFFV